MIYKELEIRGINRKDIVKYLYQLGVKKSEDQQLYQADDWSCHVGEEQSFFMFQSDIPKVKIKFCTDDQEVLEKIVKELSKKTFRAGA